MAGEEDSLVVVAVDESSIAESSNENNDDTRSVGSNFDENAEPDHDRADRISFAQISRRMELVWSLKRKQKKKKVTQQQKYDSLFPQAIREGLKPQSIHPIIRLYAPEVDTKRKYNLKEKAIAQLYCSALGFSKGTTNYDMLCFFTSAEKVPADIAGDLSLVVEYIMKQRIPEQSSKVTVGEINQLLDELAQLGGTNKHHHNHTFREAPSKGNKPQRVTTLREKWLRKVMDREISPLEHKWLVRIILGKPDFGLGHSTILKMLSPYAWELWSTYNNLESLCNRLADPNFESSRRAADDLEKQVNAGNASRWQPQSEKVVIGKIFSPMLSSKLYFNKAMTLISQNHALYLKKLPESSCLTMQYPAICCEIKLDGERMLAHVDDGKVTIQTRNGKWYSDLYSPVLGSPIRRALSSYRVNVILDGEIMAWDRKRAELVPFGSNRTIANFRRSYLRSKGLLSDIDKNFHLDDSHAFIMRDADDKNFIKTNGSNPENGKHCWLLYSVFDIVYLDGPDAVKLLKTVCGSDNVSTGSIIHLPLLQRKQLLYSLLKEQEKEVEICKSVVIRPTGECLSGERYFRTTEPITESGHPATMLDSTQEAIRGTVSNMQEIDEKRLRRLSLKEISQRRAQALEDFYQTVVEYHRKEGIVAKDLASPYILGDPSRNRKFWHKFKPDYEKGNAVDFDVVILGGYYATGLKSSGLISSFLCGCIDSENSAEFMTFCNVNGRSVNDHRFQKILEHTGFKKGTADDPVDLGKWISSEDLEGGGDLPEWISDKSFQRNGGQGDDYGGWSFTRSKNYPDLFIDPNDSAVLTIEGQELVLSEDYSLGISLRFAKIAKVRLDSVDGDEKPISEIDDDKSLWASYNRNMEQRTKTAAAIDSTLSPSKTVSNKRSTLPRRFLTPEEYQKQSRKRKRSTKPQPSSKVPRLSAQTSVLSGLTFAILEGNYLLDQDSLDAQQAKEEGWLEEAHQVEDRDDVIKFVQMHGGIAKTSPEIGEKFVLGGCGTDPRVANFMKGIDNAKAIIASSKTNSKSKQAMENLKIAESPGVLKWTFVFSLVFRWKSAQIQISTEDEGDLPPIENRNPRLLEPKTHHYLVKNILEEERAGEDIFSLDVSNLTATEFERAIEEIGSLKKDSVNIPWQNKQYWLDQLGGDSFAREQLRSNFWPFSWERLELDQVVVYPHIFGNEFGSQDSDAVGALTTSNAFDWHKWQELGLIEDSCEEVLSTIPLTTVMGAIVSCNLNKQVTHIICDLKEGVEVFAYSPHTSGMEQHFRNVEKGKSLFAHLKTLETHGLLQIVSPDWIREQWDTHFDSNDKDE